MGNSMANRSRIALMVAVWLGLQQDSTSPLRCLFACSACRTFRCIVHSPLNMELASASPTYLFPIVTLRVPGSWFLVSLGVPYATISTHKLQRHKGTKTISPPMRGNHLRSYFGEGNTGAPGLTGGKMTSSLHGKGEHEDVYQTHTGCTRKRVLSFSR